MIGLVFAAALFLWTQSNHSPTRAAKTTKKTKSRKLGAGSWLSTRTSATTSRSVQKVDRSGNRETLRSSLALLSVPSDAEIQHLFDQVAAAGSPRNVSNVTTLSLQQVEKAIVARKTQFDLAPAVVLRAFAKTDTNGDGRISRDEFFQFVRCILYYKKLMAVFASMDTNNDRHLDKQEFAEAAHVLGLDNPDAVFSEIDEHNLGYIVFDDFCIWMAEKRTIDDVVAKEGKKDI